MTKQTDRKKTKHYFIEKINNEFWIRDNQERELKNIETTIEKAKEWVKHREECINRNSGKSIFTKGIINELNKIARQELK